VEEDQTLEITDLILMITAQDQEEEAVQEGEVKVVQVAEIKIAHEAEIKLIQNSEIKTDPVREIIKVEAIKKEEDEKEFSFIFFMYFVYWVFSNNKDRPCLQS
jgi:hypothetical protein